MCFHTFEKIVDLWLGLWDPTPQTAKLPGKYERQPKPWPTGRKVALDLLMTVLKMQTVYSILSTLGKHWADKTPRPNHLEEATHLSSQLKSQRENAHIYLYAHLYPCQRKHTHAGAQSKIQEQTPGKPTRSPAQSPTTAKWWQ